MKRFNKRASAMEIATPELVWILLFGVFFVVFALFMQSALNGAKIGEEIYAKKIGLAIDEARPGTTIVLDVTKGYEEALKQKKTKERVIAEAFYLNKAGNYIQVSFSTNPKSAYKYYYFSDYDVTLSPLNIAKDGRVTIAITVGEKK